MFCGGGYGDLIRTTGEEVAAGHFAPRGAGFGGGNMEDCAADGDPGQAVFRETRPGAPHRGRRRSLGRVERQGCYVPEGTGPAHSSGLCYIVS